MNFFVSLHRNTEFRKEKDGTSRMGLTGFDGETRWCVSMRSGTMGGSLISSVGKLIGNNEYALAA